jgi:hypothetical protein
MSFENMLLNAEPEDAAEAAKIIARAFVNDPSASEEVRAAAVTILGLSTEELTQRLRQAKRRRRRPQKMMRVRRRSSQREAEPSSS